MPKESLYCIPHSQRINRKDGFVYHCEREMDADPAEKNRCQVCKKEFQDERCVKIHKTKMNHWDLPSAASSNGIILFKLIYALLPMSLFALSKNKNSSNNNL